ncbi:MAG TPA: DUF2085 domain-containing protein [Anaerolineales bacterium]
MANTSSNQTNTVIQSYEELAIAPVDRTSHRISRNWFAVFSLLMGAYVILPFLAPIFMQIGWSELGKGIYFIYSFLCHQMPQRSFFLFGPQVSYSLAELRSVGVNTTDAFLLRQFIGNPEMGWKVAWSDRMVSMYTSILLFGFAWRLLKRRIPKLPWWGFVFFLLPMAIDGTSHFISDLAGIGQGFRDSNAWLAVLTNQAFAPGFYAGDAVGSFNSWMRLLTGILFGLGVVWFGFPYMDEAFLAPVRQRQLRAELDREFLERLYNDAKNNIP